MFILYMLFVINILCYCSFVVYSVPNLLPVPYYRACKSQMYNFVTYLRKLVFYFRFKRLLGCKGRIIHLCPENVLKCFILRFLYTLQSAPRSCHCKDNKRDIWH